MKSLASRISALSVALAVLGVPAAASAFTFTNTTGGNTTGTGPYTLTSTDSTFSILRFIPNETFDFGALTNLSLDYNVLQGGVGGGAPRIVVVTDANHDSVADGQFSILLGPPGSFVDPTLGPQTSGNLIAQDDVGRYDLGGIGGSAYTNYDAALAAAGNFGVLRFSVVLDSFGGNDKTIRIAADGLRASGAVPEPSTWAMMIVGFGLAGAGLRRRRAGEAGERATA